MPGFHGYWFILNFTTPNGKLWPEKGLLKAENQNRLSPKSSTASRAFRFAEGSWVRVSRQSSGSSGSPRQNTNKTRRSSPGFYFIINLTEWEKCDFLLRKNRYLPVYRFFQRDEGFSSHYPCNVLDFFGEYIFKMLIIPCIYFDKQ